LLTFQVHFCAADPVTASHVYVTLDFWEPSPVGEGRLYLPEGLMNLSTAVSEFHRGYFATHQRSHHTRNAYRIDLKQYVAWQGPDTLMADLGPDDLEGWAAELKVRDYASSSIRRKFATLRVFLSYWVRKGLLERSPLWMIRLDLAPQKTLTRTLTVEDTRRLIREVHRQVVQPTGSLSQITPRDEAFTTIRNAAIIEVLFATGIRVGELVSLRLEDFRRSEFCLVIRGKGSRQRLAFLPDDRSRKAFTGYDRLRRAITTRHRRFFLNTRSNPLSTQGVARILAKAAELAGIEKRVTPHMLRHTVATFLLRNGANLRVVQEFLGHSSVTTTERYTAVCRQDLEEALGRHHPNHSRLVFSHN